jgi:CubicO group peptidase (beta-lactamase class C family)
LIGPLNSPWQTEKIPMNQLVRLLLGHVVGAATLLSTLAPLPVRAQQTADPPADPRRAEVTAALTAAMRAHQVPGASIALIEDYRIAWAEGFGVVAAGRDQPITPTTLFQAASISKPVAAIGVLRLVELGRLQLDEDVNPRLTTWHIPASPLTVGRPVTLRLLLSHTAGVTVHGFDGYDRTAAVPTLVQVLSGVAPANSRPVLVDQKPGYGFRYSGGGYSILQQLVTDVTGQPFAEYMRQQVLEPLGLKQSRYEQPLEERSIAGAALGHRKNLVPLPGGFHVYPELAAAGLWTTPSDLATLAIEVANTAIGRPGRLLSGATVSEMLKLQNDKVGLGFFIRGQGRGQSFGHDGANDGYRCLLVMLPATGQGLVLMTNSDTGGQIFKSVSAVVRSAYRWPAE